jgi:hypothetical protein
VGLAGQGSRSRSGGVAAAVGGAYAAGMTRAGQPEVAPGAEPGPLLPAEYDVGPPPAGRQRLANGTAIAAVMVGVPFLAAFVFLAARHDLSAFAGVAWNLIGALGLPALVVMAAAWCWRRLSRAWRQPTPPGSPPAPG